MASDAVAKAIEDLNRTLQETNRILKKLQTSSGQHNPPPVVTEPVVVPPPNEEVVEVKRTYGWSMAASVQREGGLEVGDQKVEQDDSRWIWTGEVWERVELPSGET